MSINIYYEVSDKQMNETSLEILAQVLIEIDLEHLRASSHPDLTLITKLQKFAKDKETHGGERRPLYFEQIT